MCELAITSLGVAVSPGRRRVFVFFLAFTCRYKEKELTILLVFHFYVTIAVAGPGLVPGRGELWARWTQYGFPGPKPFGPWP